MSNALKFGFLSSLIAMTLSLHSQNDDNEHSSHFVNKNSIDISLGGLGLFVSANYARTLMVRPTFFVVASAGIGTVPGIGGISVPHQITFNLGKKTSFLELGVGGSYWTGKSNSSGFTESINSYNLSPIIGWRKIIKSSFVFRVFASPLIHVLGEYYIEDYSVVPYGGVSFGYCF